MELGWQEVVVVRVVVPVATRVAVEPRCGVPPQAGHGPTWPRYLPSSAPVLSPFPAPGEGAPAPLCRENTQGLSTAQYAEPLFNLPSTPNFVPVRVQ